MLIDVEVSAVSSTAEAWNGVAEAVNSLATRLKPYAERVADEPHDEVNKALDGLGEAVDSLFDAVHRAVDDPAVRESAGARWRRGFNALTATFASISGPPRKATDRGRELPPDSGPATP